MPEKEIQRYFMYVFHVFAFVFHPINNNFPFIKISVLSGRPRGMREILRRPGWNWVIARRPAVKSQLGSPRSVPKNRDILFCCTIRCRYVHLTYLQNRIIIIRSTSFFFLFLSSEHRNIENNEIPLPCIFPFY